MRKARQDHHMTRGFDMMPVHHSCYTARAMIKSPIYGSSSLVCCRRAQKDLRPRRNPPGSMMSRAHHGVFCHAIDPSLRYA